MSSFRDQPFDQRYERMGDEAELVFESTATKGFARYGLARPPIKLSDVPAFIRYTPDYLQHDRLVEVQGFGRDQTIKLKCDKAEALWTWHDIHPVDIFLWDSSQRRWTRVSFPLLYSALQETGFDGSFDDGRNPFRATLAINLQAEWTYLDSATEQAVGT